MNKISTDGLLTLIIVIVIIGAVFLVGGINSIELSRQLDGNALVYPSSYTCCDTGDGDKCKLTDTIITWEGTNSKPEEYALLKSDISLTEGSGHIAPAEKDPNIPGVGQVFLNTTNEAFPDGYPISNALDCQIPGHDFIFNYKSGLSCHGIPNDEIIYICKTSCKDAEGEGSFDAYFRVSDGEIPDAIKNCQKPSASSGRKPRSGSQRIIGPITEKKDNLQLETFRIETDAPPDAPWLSPYCKPAIYLYPESKINVSVKVTPVGKFTHTNPLYPAGGWLVTADPSGKILSNKKEFPYLYYEADIPSLLIKKPDEGFVIEKSKIEQKLNEILPKLGLNNKEKNEMVSYWQKALPESPYYFIGVISELNLDAISPLSVSPTPDNIIRVSLYFEPLDSFEIVNEPTLITRKRSGFSVIEWGGIVKTQKPFTCLQ